MLNETNVLILSLLGGIVPALFWIWFWIREDRLRPEPKAALFSSFLGGILAVMLALFVELVIYHLLVDARLPADVTSPSIFWDALHAIIVKYDLINWQVNFWQPIQDYFANSGLATTYHINVKKSILVILIAPFIEELLKLIFSYTICLRRKINDEPIDASIYMLTTALGFAAVESALFLTQPLAQGHLMDGFIASNFRSIGPMLIHLVSSAILGIFIGLAFYKNRLKKFIYLAIGFIIAFVLHSVFNFFIVLNESTRNLTFFWTAVGETWFLVVVLLVFFEKVKKVARKR
jgi:RsiW-degrading membrane proteinase PrsW (M82 family)